MAVGGIDSVAVLLFSLGPEVAAEILKYLDPKEVQDVGSAMANIKNVNKEDVAEVYRYFIGDVSNKVSLGLGDPQYIKNMMESALGAEQAQGLVDKLSLSDQRNKGLESLHWMEGKSIADLIRNEHPQIMSIVLSYLTPDHASEVLSLLPENTRGDLMMRVASMDRIHPSALEELDTMLERQFSAGGRSGQSRSMGGVKRAADIINMLDSSSETQVLSAIRETDEEVGQTIEDLMFVFNDLIELDDRSIQRLLRDIENDRLLMSLKGADTQISEKFFGNMSQRAAELLRDDLEVAPPAKLSDVEAAQKEIIAIARKLADEGEIVMAKGGEEMI